MDVIIRLLSRADVDHFIPRGGYFVGLTMRSLHVISDLDPKAGGPPVVAVSLAAAQAALGLETTIAVGHWPETGVNPRAFFPQVPGLDRVDIRRVESPPMWHLLYGGGAAPALAELIERCDVLHLHGVWEPLLLAAAHIGQRMHKPYVVLLNGMLEPWPLSQKRLKKRIALSLVYRSMLNRAAALHVLNEDERRYTAQLGFASELSVIPNGIFREQMDRLPLPGRFRAAHPDIGERPFVLFVGRLHVVKGLDVLAEAFALVAAAHDNACLVVVGPDGGARAGFVTRLQQLGIFDRVVLPGPIYGDAKFDALVDATCFCLPSRQEAFSVAILEALACGKPVVVSDQCHFPEVASAGAGFVAPLSPSALAGRLIELISDGVLCKRMGEAAQLLVRNRFTWTRVAEMTIGLYEEILSRTF